LYVLYEGYGYSVASLYCLGFFTGAVTAPITGPLIDKFGRKKSAAMYCLLEIGINMLEQFPFLSGLIFSRMVGGITTNLLGSVFETWLDTEYRQRGFEQSQYELIMRDSVVVNNLAAIASGYVAHKLAERIGPKGPFEGAVTCSAIALAVVLAAWTENYGSSRKEPKSSTATPTQAGEKEEEDEKSGLTLLKDAVEVFKSDSRVLRVCILQGLTMGTVQIFVFLWTPMLKKFAENAPAGTIGLDSHGDPAYGLIFGAYMAAGVLGGLSSPYVRRVVTFLLSPFGKATVTVAGEELDPFVTTLEGETEVRPMAVEFLAAMCYIACAALLMVPRLVSGIDELSFSTALGAFVLYEFLVGMYSPCEGVIRSLYIPSETRGSMMTLPSIIVNVAVAMGVASTNFFS
jgi:MFS transporter, MFS domain-containing protein family, molybdate-anion transporter